jgi:deazaflavin-dependent oxidoreductase (nitroreductase family)
VWSKGQIVRLETIGRKTSRPHQVLVRYATSDGRIIIFPENTGRQDWVANLVSNPHVRLYSDFGIFEGNAVLKRVDGLDDPVLKVFMRKYGLKQVKERYWGQRRYVEVKTTSSLGSPDINELIYGDLEVAFDSVAEKYDHHILDNPMNRWLRNVSVGLLSRLFKPGDTVLELGCGTGTETVSLASFGVNVIACDISGRMLEVLKGKAERAGLSGRITTVHSRASEAVQKVRSMGITQLDGAYSTYGAINTEPKVLALLHDLHTILKPNGKLVLGVWNKFCLFEIAGYILRLNFGMALSRLKNPVPVGRSRFCISSYSYSVGDMVRAAHPFFKVERVFGVEIFLPPSNLTRYLPRGFALSALKKLDIYAGSASPFNRLGDHFLVVFKNHV